MSTPSETPRGRRFTIDAPATVLKWLLTVEGMTNSKAKNLLRFGSVTVNGVPATRHDVPLKPGDEVFIVAAREARGAGRAAAVEAKLEILFEDEHLVAIDKPEGLLTIATGDERERTAHRLLSERARARRDDAGRVFVVHRLDRDTSGVVVFAKSEAAKNALQEAWGGVTKTYLAVVEGTPAPAEATLIHWLREDAKTLRVTIAGEGPGAQRAVTRYRVKESRGGRALLEVRIDTGRKHQIRVQLAAIGHPVVGDPRYGRNEQKAPRLGLHAARLEFAHPVTGVRTVVQSADANPLRGLMR